MAVVAVVCSSPAPRSINWCRGLASSSPAHFCVAAAPPKPFVPAHSSLSHTVTPLSTRAATPLSSSTPHPRAQLLSLTPCSCCSSLPRPSSHSHLVVAHSWLIVDSCCFSHLPRPLICIANDCLRALVVPLPTPSSPLSPLRDPCPRGRVRDGETSPPELHPLHPSTTASRIPGPVPHVRDHVEGEKIPCYTLKSRHIFV